jgi:NADPH:quinone reductase-like Zn-dependent oxidoreductase
MKAMLISKYGLDKGLSFGETEVPVIRDDEVLVEVHASCVNTNSLLLATGKPLFVRLFFGSFTKPNVRIPGSDLAGTVVAVGSRVKDFAPGDEVFAENGQSRFGAFAEFVAVPHDQLCRKPANLSFDEAAAVPQAAVVALQGLRTHGRVCAGQRVLVYGASGGIGSFAVQIAKHFGAEVTGVCSGRHLDMVRSIGADYAIDYTKEDYTRSDKRYDCIFAVAQRSIFDHLRALRRDGIYVSTGGPSIRRMVDDMLIGRLLPKDGGKRVAAGWTALPGAQDLKFIATLIEKGSIRPVIDRRFPLIEAAEALRYYQSGHPAGKVVVTVRNPTAMST